MRNDPLAGLLHTRLGSVESSSTLNGGYDHPMWGNGCARNDRFECSVVARNGLIIC